MKKLKKTPAEVAKLKKWLSENQKNKMKLAIAMEHGTTEAVQRWVDRTRINRFMIDKVMKFIKEN